MIVQGKPCAGFLWLLYQAGPCFRDSHLFGHSSGTQKSKREVLAEQGHWKALGESLSSFPQSWWLLVLWSPCQLHSRWCFRLLGLFPSWPSLLFLWRTLLWNEGMISPGKIGVMSYWEPWVIVSAKYFSNKITSHFWKLGCRHASCSSIHFSPSNPSLSYWLMWGIARIDSVYSPETLNIQMV